MPPSSMSAEQPKAPGIAVTSFVLGILGLFTCLLTGIPAIITGHMAQRRIKASGGALGGAGLALSGTILGYVTTVGSLVSIPLTVAMVLPAISMASGRAEQAANISKAGQIHLALITYAGDNNDRFPPDLDSLISAGYLNDPLALDHKDGTTITRWTYYPGLQGNDYSSIILAGPASTASSRQRILVFVDGAIRAEDEADAQRLANSQGITLP